MRTPLVILVVILGLGAAAPASATILGPPERSPALAALLGPAVPAAAATPRALATFGDPSAFALRPPALAFAASDAGGGGDVAAVVGPALAFILGVIPGFGVGHLVSANIGGFVSWLITDLVVALAFGLGEALLWGPAGLGTVRVIAIIAVSALRLFEGFSAMRAAQRVYSMGDGLVEPGAQWAAGGGPRPAPAPAVRLARFAF